MLSKKEIENMKIGLHNIRANNLMAMQCSLADTEDKEKWLKEIDIIDNTFEYIEQLEADNYEANKRIDEYIEERKKIIEELKEIRTNLNRDGFVGYADDITDILEFMGVED